MSLFIYSKHTFINAREEDKTTGHAPKKNDWARLLVVVAIVQLDQPAGNGRNKVCGCNLGDLAQFNRVAGWGRCSQAPKARWAFDDELVFLG